MINNTQKICLVGYEHYIPDAKSVISVENIIGQQQKFLFSTKEKRLWIANYKNIQHTKFFVTYITDLRYKRDKKLTEILE